MAYAEFDGKLDGEVSSAGFVPFTGELDKPKGVLERIKGALNPPVAAAEESTGAVDPMTGIDPTGGQAIEAPSSTGSVMDSLPAGAAPAEFDASKVGFAKAGANRMQRDADTARLQAVGDQVMQQGEATAIKPSIYTPANIAGNFADNARNVGAGVLKISPTAVKGVADIGRLATGDTVGRDTSEYMKRGMDAIDQIIGSDQFNQAQTGFKSVMNDPNQTVGDMFSYLIDHPNILLDNGITTIGSMALPAGVAGAAVKLGAKGVGATAAAIGTGSAQNAADTFSELDKQSLPDRYKGAAVSAAVSILMGIATGGGAEGEIARKMAGNLTSGKIGLEPVKAYLKATFKEAAQEGGEELGNAAGEAVGSGVAPDPTNLAKRTAFAATLGGIMGGGTHAVIGGESGPGPAEMAAENARQTALTKAETMFAPLQQAKARATIADIQSAATVDDAIAAATSVVGEPITASAPQISDQQQLIAELEAQSGLTAEADVSQQTIPAPADDYAPNAMQLAMQQAQRKLLLTPVSQRAEQAATPQEPSNAPTYRALHESIPLDPVAPSAPVQPDTAPGRAPDAQPAQGGTIDTTSSGSVAGRDSAADGGTGQPQPALTPAVPSKADDIAGEDLNRQWTAFADDSGTLGIPRAEMPQIKAEHRGAMVNFLNARGITHEQVEVDPSTLKPTQLEFSQSKVNKAKSFTGSDRSILISSDGHVLDGHHLWLAKREAGEPVKVIRLNAPIRKLLADVAEFPSAEVAGGATPAGVQSADSGGGINNEKTAALGRQSSAESGVPASAEGTDQSVARNAGSDRRTMPDIGPERAQANAGDGNAGRPSSDLPATDSVQARANEVTQPAGSQQQPDRRQDVTTRKSVAAMSADEMRQALLVDDMTGLGNKRAYNEVAKKPFQASIDIDSLKWVNDNLGHDAGDKLIQSVGQALREESGDAYHLSGDEFAAQFDDEQAGHALLKRVRDRLKDAVIEYTAPDGTVITKKGAEFSYGIANSIEGADAKLRADKAAREASGERAGRGAEPVGVVKEPAAGRQVKDNTATEEVAPEPVTKEEAADLIAQSDMPTAEQIKINALLRKGDVTPADVMAVLQPVARTESAKITDVAEKAGTTSKDIATPQDQRVAKEADKDPALFFRPGTNPVDFAVKGGVIPKITFRTTEVFKSKSHANLYRLKNHLTDTTAVEVAGGWSLEPKAGPLTAAEQKEARTDVAALNRVLKANGQPEVLPLLDVPSANHELARRLGKIFGTRIQFVSNNDAFDGVAVNGIAYLTKDLKRPELAIAGHEVFHTLEQTNPAMAEDLLDHVRGYLQEGVIAARQQRESLLSGEATTERYAAGEIMADINGAMWLDPLFWREMLDRDRNLFRRVAYLFMEKMTKAVESLAGTRFDVSALVTDVNAVRKLIAQTWAHRNQQGDTREADETGLAFSRGNISSMREFNNSAGDFNPDLDPYWLKQAQKEINGDSLSDEEYNVAVAEYANQYRIDQALEDRGWTQRGLSNVSSSRYYVKNSAEDAAGEYKTYEIRVSDHEDRYPADDTIERREQINFRYEPINDTYQITPDATRAELNDILDNVESSFNSSAADNGQPAFSRAEESELQVPGFSNFSATTRSDGTISFFGRAKVNGSSYFFNIKVTKREDGAPRIALGDARFETFQGKSVKGKANVVLEDLMDVARDAALAWAANDGQPAFSRAEDTIMVDGVERPTTNSDGKPIAYTKPILENFWRWFENSRVTDDQGRPLVVYHGAGADFDVFDRSKAGNGPGASLGFFFATDKEFAQQYAKRHNRMRLVEAYLSIKNPRALTTDDISHLQRERQVEDLRADMATQEQDGGHNAHNGVWIALESAQIKSATDNQGTFDPSEPDIRFSRKERTEADHALKALSEIDPLFKFPKSKEKEVEDIAHDNIPGVQVRKLTNIPGETRFNFTFSDGKTARLMVRYHNPYGNTIYGYDMVDGEMTAQVDERPGRNAEYLDGKDDVFIDVSLLKEGSGFGARMYNIAATYAYNNGKVFIGDPAGLSDEALRRRPEQMLSSALKFGTTEHLAPHPRQIKGDKDLGVPGLDWVYGDHIGNIEKLIQVNLANIENAGGNGDIVYNKQDGTFTDIAGNELSRNDITGMAELGLGRAAEAGGSTLARHALFKSLLRSESGVVQQSNGVLESLLEQLRQHDSADSDGPFKDLFYSRKDVTDAIPEETSLEGKRRIGQDKFNRFKVLQSEIEMAAAKGAGYDGDNIHEARDFLIEKNVVNPINDAADVYQAETLMSGRISVRKEDFRERQMKPLIKKTQSAGLQMAQIADFLKMQHAPEANARARELHGNDATAYGVTDDEAAAAMRKFKALPNYAALKSIANEWRGITEQSKKILLDAGIITQDMANAWEATYAFYIPVKGAENKSGGGKGLSVNGKQKRRLGHSQRDEAILENILRDHERAIANDEVNQVGMALIRFGLAAKNPDIMTIDKPVKRQVLKDAPVFEVLYKGNFVAAFESEAKAESFMRKDAAVSKRQVSDYAVEETDNPYVTLMISPMLADNEVNVYLAGQAVRIQINDEIAARAYTNLGVERLGAILSVGREINTWLSKVYTGYSPDFIFTNPIRDAIQGSITLTGEHGAGMAAKIFLNYPHAAKELIKHFRNPGKSKLVTEYRAAGGSTGAAYLSDLERIGNDVMKAYDEYAGSMNTYRRVYAESIDKGFGAAKANSYALMKAGAVGFRNSPIVGHFLSLMERINSVTENALRVATYKTLVDNGISRPKAAAQAKNLMNFNRKGELSNQAGALYLFFNPSVQGSTILVESLSTSKHKWQARALAGTMTLAAFALAELARGGGDDDEEKWKRTPKHVKDRNMVVGFGDYQFMLPVPYGYGVFHVLGNVISDYMHGEDGTKLGIRLASSVFDNFSPVGNPMEGKSAVFSMSPTLLKLAGGPGMNENSFGQEIAPKAWSEAKPDSQLMYRNTKGTTYAAAAEALNKLTGGSKFEKGVVDVSPETLKYWVKSLTGGAGQFAFDAINVPAMVVQGVDPDPRDIPVARRFVREIGVTDARSAFWEKAKEAQAAADAFKSAKKAHDREAAGAIFNENKALISLARYAENVQKMAKAQRDESDRIRMDDTLSLSSKREKMKLIEMKEIAIYQNFLKNFEARSQVFEEQKRAAR